MVVAVKLIESVTICVFITSKTQTLHRTHKLFGSQVIQYFFIIHDVANDHIY